MLELAKYIDVSEQSASFIYLYESANSGNERSYIKALRIKSKGLLCPYCGRPGCGTLDHYYPKDDFPQFAILENNLIPCCWGCNKVKLSSWSSNPLARFINPYYDEFLESFIFHVKFELINSILAFTILPSRNLKGNEKSVVAFHLKHIQIQEYHFESIVLSFQKYSKTIQDLILNGDSIDKVITILQLFVDNGGHLEWDTIVLRSIITDPDNLNLARSYTHIP